MALVVGQLLILRSLSATEEGLESIKPFVGNFVVTTFNLKFKGPNELGRYHSPNFGQSFESTFTKVFLST